MGHGLETGQQPAELDVTVEDRSDSTSMPMEVAGKYRLIAALGRGGMADVYLAVNKGPKGFTKLVVVKRLRPGLGHEQEFLRMFLEEARLAARLQHPNIVDTYEVGSSKNEYFIAMEYLDGQSFQAALRALGRSKGFTFAMQVRVLIETLSALQAAHEMTDFDGSPMAVVHRDVSPHNIFITYNGQVKLVDFGIAKATNSSSETATGLIKGKVRYMAPEQARGTGVDPRADLYSVGVMLWEAVKGHRRWQSLPDTAVLGRLFTDEGPEPPGAVSHGLPALVDDICVKALAVKPEDRYASATDFQIALEGLLATLPSAPSAREIGRTIGKHFENERKEVKTVIEKQLDILQRIETGTDDISTAPVPRLTALPTLRPASDTGASTFANVALPDDNPPPAKSKRLPIAAAAASFLVAGGVAALVHSRSSHVAPAAPPAEVIERTPSDSPRAKPGQVRVLVSPPTATLYVDGTRVENPYVANVQLDNTEHQLRAEAAGYSAVERRVNFSKEAAIEMSLPATSSRKTETSARPEPRGRPATPATHVAEPTENAAPAPAPKVDPAPAASGKKSTVVLDEADPWKGN